MQPATQCKLLSTDTINSQMRHPPNNVESFELNLGQAFNLRCSTGPLLSCGQCEACTVRHKLRATRCWFQRAADPTRARFIQNLLEQLDSADLLRNIARLLRPLTYKEGIYAVSGRCMTVNKARKSSAAMLRSGSTENAMMVDDLRWFRTANFWSKSQYMMLVFQMCPTALLHRISNTVDMLMMAAGVASNDDAGGEENSGRNLEFNLFSIRNPPDLELLDRVLDKVHPDWSTHSLPFLSGDDASENPAQPLHGFEIDKEQAAISSVSADHPASARLHSDAHKFNAANGDTGTFFCTISGSEILYTEAFANTDTQRAESRSTSMPDASLNATIENEVSLEQEAERRSSWSELTPVTMELENQTFVLDSHFLTPGQDNIFPSVSAGEKFSIENFTTASIPIDPAHHSASNISLQLNRRTTDSASSKKTKEHDDGASTGNLHSRKAKNRRISCSVQSTRSEDLSSFYTTRSLSSSASRSSGSFDSTVRFKSTDFVRSLPVHLSKYVLSLLDQQTRLTCWRVCRQWRALVDEVILEKSVVKRLQQEIKSMQGAMILVCNPHYARDAMVTVPNLLPQSWQVKPSGHSPEPGGQGLGEVSQNVAGEGAYFKDTYPGCSTRRVILEERNEYCGPYNVLVISDRSDSSRVVAMDRGKLIAIGCDDKRVKVINSDTNQVLLPLISGHVASVTCVAMCDKSGFVLSGSFDTTIRKWSLTTRKCLRIYHGHSETVNVLALHTQYFASGSQDKSCRVWELEGSKCLRTFKHKEAVTAVHLSDDLCVSGCTGGAVKVWHLKSGELIKKLKGHRGAMTAIALDAWHIVTSALDSLVMVWSAQGDYSRALMTLRHPKSVLCLAFLYLRAVTGCEDGKIRVWSVTSGLCLRTLRGSRRCDPVTQLIAIDSRILVNTYSSSILLKFEPVEYDYLQRSDAAVLPSKPRPQQALPSLRLQGSTRSGTPAHSTPQYSHAVSRRNRFDLAAIESQQRDGSQRLTSSKSSNQVEDSTEKKDQLRPESSTKSHISGPSALSNTNLKSIDVATSESSYGDFGTAANDNKVSQWTASSKPHRRISWAFEYPDFTTSKNFNLSQTKKFLKKRIRNNYAAPPEFLSRAVMDVQSNTGRPSVSGYEEYFEENARQLELLKLKRSDRPSSSPGRLNIRSTAAYPPKTKATSRQDEIGLESVAESDASAESEIQDVNFMRTLITPLVAQPIRTISTHSEGSRPAKVSIPRPSLIRPHSSMLVYRSDRDGAEIQRRPRSAMITGSGRTGCGQAYVTSPAVAASMAPMLMFNKPAAAVKRDEVVQKRVGFTADAKDSVTAEEKSRFVTLDPYRYKTDFKLLTRQQLEVLVAEA